MRIKPKDTKTLVVLVGNFNPRIFTPSWFAKSGVIGEEEADTAYIEIIHQEVVKFRLEWLTLLVEPNRFIAEVDQPPDIRLYDFVLKTFGELLIHTPIWMLGINKRIIFDAGSVEKRDELGFKLAPPTAWGEWSEGLLKQSEKLHGGLVTLSMRQSVTDDREFGYIQTKVEPSKTGDSDVLVEVNDHYESKEGSQVAGCQELITVLAHNYETSIKRSEWIADQVMGIVK